MIEARVIAGSYHTNFLNRKKHVWTLELVYPRFIHSEVMTHKMLSKNAASSRAIPIEKTIELIRQDPAMPVHWGKNQAGMQAKEQLSGEKLDEARKLWILSAETACAFAEKMSALGGHKQWVNRILEPYQHMKTVMTGTEWENLLFLRDHKDAQPEFEVLARKIKKAMMDFEPKHLRTGEWHVPYFQDGYWLNDECGYSIEQALMISASCCAQTSFRKSDDSLEKAEKVYNMLNLHNTEGIPKHTSPTEHQATPIDLKEQGPEFKGVTSTHKQLGIMSGNLAEWIQYRQLIADNTVW